ncbi:MAG: ankyrin repeat domain-containing protein, partial [Oscillospiraceae bacterium]|nr:ankyrin repeat domain-containing protein [Oscillospiraceae bacterium]
SKGMCAMINKYSEILSADMTYELTESIPPANKPVSTRRFAPGALILLVLLFLMLLPQQAMAKFYSIKATEELLYVANRASVEDITRLIKEDADVNATDSMGKTPLMLAAEFNTNPEVIRILIEGGAYVNKTDKNFNTPLMIAAEFNENLEVLIVLIEGGADLTERNRQGKNALDCAEQRKVSKDTDVYNFLQEKTIAAYKAKEATKKLKDIAAVASVKEINRLIQEGADVNAFDSNRFTPLMIAAEKNTNPEVIRILIEGGADVNATFSYTIFGFKTEYIERLGYTPWMLAVRYNPNPEVLRVLIENVADINYTDRKGFTPLVIAAEFNKNLEVLRVLIERGADVNAADEAGNTPLLMAASRSSTPEVLQNLIEGGADVNAANDKNGYTPLMIAAEKNPNPEVTQFLIKWGADVNAVSFVKKSFRVQTSSGCDSPFGCGPSYKTETEFKVYTPLIAAMYNSNPGIAQLLIDNGASESIAKLLQIVNKGLDNTFMIILLLLFIVFTWIPMKRRIKKGSARKAGIR